MERLNTVLPNGTFGMAVSSINTNFSLIVSAINGLEYSSTKSKGIRDYGFIPSTETLPNAANGDWCMVLSEGNTFPATIWTFDGTTWSQGGTWNPEGIDLSSYAKTTEMTAAIAASLAQAIAQIGYAEVTVSGTTLSASLQNYVLPTSGGTIHLKMSAPGTGASTLNINNTGAKELWYNGAAVSDGNTWEANEIISVFYDGTRYMASNSQGGGKADSQLDENSTLPVQNKVVTQAINNLSENLQDVEEDLETEQKNILTGFQIATNKASTIWYATRIGFEKGKRYHIRVTASAAYTKVTTIILQLVSQQYEGQVSIGSLPANSLSAEFDYYCTDDNLQYLCVYASGNHTITYGIVVSEYLEINEAVNKNSNILCPQGSYVDFYMTSTFVIATAVLTRSKIYEVRSGQKYRIKANSTRSSYILFLTSLPETLTNNQDLSSYGVGSEISIAPNTEKIIEIPATAGIMWVNVSTYYQGNFIEYEPEYVSIIDEGSEGFDDVTNSNEWILKNGIFFGSNGKYVLNEGSAFKYIPVQVGEKYVIVANSRCWCVCGLMRSIPATITHWSDVDAVGYADIPYKQDLTLEIPSGCNYLAVSVANAYKDYEPSYVGKLSSAKSLNDNTIINTALINNVNAERILLFPVYGQSLAIGGDATPITTYCRFPKNCANNTTLGLQFGQSLETSIYGLVESYVDFKGQEDRIPATRQTDIIASFSSGQGSTPIANLKKGTTLYNNLISSITSAYNNRAKNKFIVPAFCWIQGEGDINNGVDYYYSELSQLRVDLDADIKAITGQTEDVHCIVYQTNQLCPTAGSYYNPTAYASGGSPSARMDGSVVALWKLVRDSQYFHVSSPIYSMDFVVSPNNAIIHISGVSQKLLGYYEGLAAKRLMDGHGDDIGLYVTGVTKIDNTHIRLSLHVPAPPVVIDTESVYETANYGFSVINENSQNIISGVNIERNNLDSTTILITTSADCTNAKVRYGVNGTNGYSGFDKGPRGNIRDSQGLWYKAVINNKKVPMHNWLLFFEYLIN